MSRDQHDSREIRVVTIRAEDLSIGDVFQYEIRRGASTVWSNWLAVGEIRITREGNAVVTIAGTARARASMNRLDVVRIQQFVVPREEREAAEGMSR